MKTLRCWACVAPSGRILISTVGATRAAAKRRLLNPFEQKYYGLVTTNFEKWEAKGYRCERVQIKQWKK